MKEHEMNFHYLYSVSKDKKIMLYRHQKIMEMVPYLRVFFITGLLGSKAKFLWKTENVNDGQLDMLIKNNPDPTTWDIAEALHISVVSVENTWVHESLRCLGDL